MPSALPPPEMQAYDGGDSEEPAGPASSTRQRDEAERCCIASLSLRENTKMRKKFNSWIFLDST